MGQVALFSLMIGLMFLQIDITSAPDWKKALGYTGVGVFGGGVLFLLIKLYIVSWRILTECGAVKAERLKKGELRNRSVR